MKKDIININDEIEVYKSILRGTLTRVPVGFWKERKTRIKIMKYLIEEVLQWTEEDIKDKLSQKLLIEYKLSGMINIYYCNSPYKAINDAYPNKFKPWEFKYTTLNTWDNEETCREAVKWLIEEKLQWTEDEIRNNLSQKAFNNNKLRGLLVNKYNGSPYRAINDAYPNKFKPWEFNMVPMNTWNDENTCKEAVRWLIEEKLQWTEEDIKNKLTQKTFANNKLYGLLVKYNNSPYGIIKEVYPNIKPWELKRAPQHMWNDDTCKEAVKWLIEEKLQWKEDEIKDKICTQIFYDYGLRGLLDTYGSSTYEVINVVYPNKYSKKELSKRGKKIRG